MFFAQGKKGPLPTENRSPLISNTAGMNNIIVYDGSTLLVIDANSVNLNAGSSALQEEMARERIVRDKILGSYNFTPSQTVHAKATVVITCICTMQKGKPSRAP